MSELDGPWCATCGIADPTDEHLRAHEQEAREAEVALLAKMVDWDALRRERDQTLANALEQVKAKAWDEGYVHGYTVGVEEGATGRLVESVAPNPYREDQTDGQ